MLTRRSATCVAAYLMMKHNMTATRVSLLFTTYLLVYSVHVHHILINRFTSMFTNIFTNIFMNRLTSVFTYIFTNIFKNIFSNISTDLFTDLFTNVFTNRFVWCVQ